MDTKKLTAAQRAELAFMVRYTLPVPWVANDAQRALYEAGYIDTAPGLGPAAFITPTGRAAIVESK